MASPGAPRPGNAPPNYNPSLLADNMQNLQINRPNQPPSNANAPRQPTPFGQQPPPFAGVPSVSRPGPPPSGAFLRGPVPPGGPPQSTLPSNAAVHRPTGPPPVNQLTPPFVSRPLLPGALPPPVAGSTVLPPPGTVPSSGLGPRPGSPTTGPAFPPSSSAGLTSNGPPAFGSGSRIPPTGSTPRPPIGGPPLTMMSSAPLQPPGMRLPFGGPASTASPGIAQPVPPFVAASQHIQPPPGSSTFSSPAQGMPLPSGSPYAPQSWPMQPGQVIFWISD